MKRYIVYLLGFLIQFARCENTNFNIIENIVIYCDVNLLVELFYYNGHQLCFSFNGDVRFNLVDKSKLYRKNYLLQVGVCYNYDISWWIGNVQLTNVFFNIAWVKLLNNQNKVDMKKYLDFSVFVGFFTYWFIFGFYFINWSKYQKDFGMKINFRIFNLKIFNFSAGGVIAYKNNCKSHINQIYVKKSTEDIKNPSDDFEVYRSNPFFTTQEHKKESDEINRCIGYCDSLYLITILDEGSKVIKDYYRKYITFEERRNNLSGYFSGYAYDILMLAFSYRDCKISKLQIESQKEKIIKNIKEFNYKLDGRFPIIEFTKRRIFKNKYQISEYENKLNSLKNDYDNYKTEHAKNSKNIQILTNLIKILSEPKKLNISKINDQYNMKLVNIFENIECLEVQNIDDILKYLNYDYEQDIKREAKEQDLEEEEDSNIDSFSATSSENIENSFDEDNDLSKKSKEEIDKEKIEDKQKLLTYLNQALLEEQNIKEKIEIMNKECELWKFVIDSNIEIFKNAKVNFEEEVFKQSQEDNDKVIELYEREIEKEKKKKQKTNIFDVI